MHNTFKLPIYRTDRARKKKTITTGSPLWGEPAILQRTTPRCGRTHFQSTLYTNRSSILTAQFTWPEVLISHEGDYCVLQEAAQLEIMS